MWDKMLCHVLEEWNILIPCCLLIVFKNLLIFHPEGGKAVGLFKTLVILYQIISYMIMILTVSLIYLDLVTFCFAFYLSGKLMIMKKVV